MTRDVDKTLAGATVRRIAVCSLAWDFLERVAEERGIAPEDLAAELIEQGVSALGAQLAEAGALRVTCPVCGAAAGAACTRGAAAQRVFAKRPHARRFLAARHVAQHARIGGEGL